MAANLEEARQNIVVTIVGLFLAVAFGSMANHVADEIPHLEFSFSNGYWPSVTLTLAIASAAKSGRAFVIGLVALHCFQMLWATVRIGVFKLSVPWRWYEYAIGLTAVNILILTLLTLITRYIYLLLIPY